VPRSAPFGAVGSIFFVSPESVKNPFQKCWLLARCELYAARPPPGQILLRPGRAREAGPGRDYLRKRTHSHGGRQHPTPPPRSPDSGSAATDHRCRWLRAPPLLAPIQIIGVKSYPGSARSDCISSRNK